MFPDRVLSGMRPTGALHLGHYHGVLKNWIKLQHEHPCLFFVADWHALTTHYEDPAVIGQNVWDMVSTGSRPGSIRRKRPYSFNRACPTMRSSICCCR